MKRWTVLVAVVAVALALSSCGSDKKPASLGGTTVKGGGGTVTAYTTAQLARIVNDLGLAYTAKVPGVHVRVIVEATAAIGEFVAAGQPQIAIADEGTIKAAAKKLTVHRFGRNLAVIAVATANPRHIADVKAFAAGSGLRTVVCGAATSIGNFAVGVLAKAGVKPAPSTIHPPADCLTKYLSQIAAGTLDAALLFRNDATLPKGVKLLSIPDAQNLVVNFSYVTVGSSAPIVAFGDFIAGATGRHVLTLNGYLP